jgi:methionine synthase I (cobalamin-dependent)
MKLSEAIKSNKILLLDGATGTELAKRGLMGKADANLVNPDKSRKNTPDAAAMR